MTHRDGFPRLSARSAWRGDAGHRPRLPSYPADRPPDLYGSLSTLLGITFALELNDRPFAQGLSNQAVTVPRLGEARLRVVTSTTLIDLVRQVLILGARSDLSYRIEGVVYLRGAARRKLPYETSGRMRLLPAQPNERILVPL